jgi:hypothetical protein
VGRALAHAPGDLPKPVTHKADPGLGALPLKPRARAQAKPGLFGRVAFGAPSGFAVRPPAGSRKGYVGPAAGSASTPLGVAEVTNVNVSVPVPVPDLPLEEDIEKAPGPNVPRSFTPFFILLRPRCPPQRRNLTKGQRLSGARAEARSRSRSRVAQVTNVNVSVSVPVPDLVLLRPRRPGRDSNAAAVATPASSLLLFSLNQRRARVTRAPRHEHSLRSRRRRNPLGGQPRRRNLTRRPRFSACTFTFTFTCADDLATYTYT